MLKMHVTACIEAPAKKTWETLADIENIPLWAESVLTAHCPGGSKRGKGAERVCQLKGNIDIREKWVEWDEGKSYTYLGYDLPLVKAARNKWSVSEVDGKTLLTSESEVTLKGGIFGVLLEPLMLLAGKRMAANSLAALKYLVENGRPYEGKHSLLPRVASTC